MVDEYLRVKGRKNIFAIGDITDVPVSLTPSVILAFGLFLIARMLLFTINYITNIWRLELMGPRET
jgi:NADPH-dependent 2,4-dienoyl-CoA reductase/sulfur reductase-like enzyme